MRIVRKINSILVSFAVIASFAAAATSFLATTQVAAAPTPAPVVDCNSGFLGFPAWYRGLTDGSCNIMSPNDPAVGGLAKFIWHIALNIVEIVLVAVAYVSGGFTLYGGFLFITSRGKPEGAARARMTILDSVVGLIIAFFALAITQFIITGVIK